METKKEENSERKKTNTEKHCYHPVLQASLTKGEIVCMECGRTVYSGHPPKMEQKN